MSRFNYSLAPAMFIVSGFAATQAHAATTIQTFDQLASANADVFIGGSTTAQYSFTGTAATGSTPTATFATFATIGNSAIGAKNSGQFPTANSNFTSPASTPFIIPVSDLQLRFDIDGVTNIGLARFSQTASSGFSLDSVEYGVAAVPEPATWAMMIAGFGLMGASLRASRRRKGQAALA